MNIWLVGLFIIIEYNCFWYNINNTIEFLGIGICIYLFIITFVCIYLLRNIHYAHQGYIYFIKYVVIKKKLYCEIL